MSDNEKIVILYHGNCPDGFGGAYAAWKKFGDAAEYRMLHHGRPAPEDITDSRVYFVDFCYPRGIMETFLKNNTSVTVLDHHEGVVEVVREIPEHVYDAQRSGATIAWSYFHPSAKVPELLKYVEDGDLYRFALPESREILTYVYAKPFEFKTWDMLATALEDQTERAQIVAVGQRYREYFDIQVNQIAVGAELVRFEGYECYLGSGTRVFISDVGHALYEKHPPIALVANVRADGLRISLRGNGTVDVSEIARKYGGNGHPNSAAFSLPWGTPIPWEILPKE